MLNPDYTRSCLAAGKQPFPKNGKLPGGQTVNFDHTKHQVCILLFDAYSVHISREFAAFLAAKHPYIRIVMVPAGCTGIAQVPDLILNRTFKAAIKAAYDRWATGELRRQLQAGTPKERLKLDLSLSNIKPLTVRLLVDAYDQLVALQPSIVKAFEHVGVLQAWDPAFQRESIRPGFSPATAATASPTSQQMLRGRRTVKWAPMSGRIACPLAACRSWRRTCWRRAGTHPRCSR